MNLTLQVKATLIAALRFYREEGQGDPNRRSDAIHELATGMAPGLTEVTSLDNAGLRDLEARIRQTPVETDDGIQRSLGTLKQADDFDWDQPTEQQVLVTIDGVSLLTEGEVRLQIRSPSVSNAEEATAATLNINYTSEGVITDAVEISTGDVIATSSLMYDEFLALLHGEKDGAQARDPCEIAPEDVPRVLRIPGTLEDGSDDLFFAIGPQLSDMPPAELDQVAQQVIQRFNQEDAQSETGCCADGRSVQENVQDAMLELGVMAIDVRKTSYCWDQAYDVHARRDIAPGAADRPRGGA